MAYNSSELHQVIECGNGINIWKYRSPNDNAATVQTAGYISDAQIRGMNIGDLVIIDQFSSAALTAITATTFSVVTAVASSGATLSSSIAGGTVVIAGSGASNPVAGTDNTLGYAIGSYYQNTTSGDVFLCTSASTGAAVWAPVGPNKVVLNYTSLPTIGSGAATAYFVAPFKFQVLLVQAVLNGALASANGTLTFSIGSTAITGGAITLTQAGSAAGSVFSATPSALNTGAAGAMIKGVISGGDTSASTCNINVLLAQTM